MVSLSKDNKVPVNEADLSDRQQENGSQDNQSSISLPRALVIEYATDIKKSILKKYIESEIEERFNPSLCFYQIIPFKKGFLYEVHEGGDGKSLLKSLKTKLLEGDNVVVQIATAKNDVEVHWRIKDIDDEDGGVLSCINKRERSKITTDGIEFKGSMIESHPVKKGAFILSSIVMCVAVAAGISGIWMKHSLNMSNEKFVPYQSSIQSPSSILKELKALGIKGGEYYLDKAYLTVTGDYKLNKIKQSDPLETARKRHSLKSDNPSADQTETAQAADETVDKEISIDITVPTKRPVETTTVTPPPPTKELSPPEPMITSPNTNLKKKRTFTLPSSIGAQQ